MRGTLLQALTVLGMKIRNLNLPKEMITAIQTGLLRRDVGSWQLKTDCDSYGYLLETELGEFYESEQPIINATKQLSSDFVIDGVYGVYGDGSLPDYPGAIQDITDFRYIICFGSSGDGAPFCLDYRSSIEDPSVIWWDDINRRERKKIICEKIEEFYEASIAYTNACDQLITDIQRMTYRCESGYYTNDPAAYALFEQSISKMEMLHGLYFQRIDFDSEDFAIDKMPLIWAANSGELARKTVNSDEVYKKSRDHIKSSSDRLSGLCKELMHKHMI